MEQAEHFLLLMEQAEHFLRSEELSKTVFISWTVKTYYVGTKTENLVQSTSLIGPAGLRMLDIGVVEDGSNVAISVALGAALVLHPALQLPLANVADNSVVARDKLEAKLPIQADDAPQN